MYRTTLTYSLWGSREEILVRSLCDDGVRVPSSFRHLLPISTPQRGHRTRKAGANTAFLLPFMCLAGNRTTAQRSSPRPGPTRLSGRSRTSKLRRSPGTRLELAVCKPGSVVKDRHPSTPSTRSLITPLRARNCLRLLLAPALLLKLGFLVRTTFVSQQARWCSPDFPRTSDGVRDGPTASWRRRRDSNPHGISPATFPR